MGDLSWPSGSWFAQSLPYAEDPESAFVLGPRYTATLSLQHWIIILRCHNQQRIIILTCIQSFAGWPTCRGPGAIIVTRIQTAVANLFDREKRFKSVRREVGGGGGGGGIFHALRHLKRGSFCALAEHFLRGKAVDFLGKKQQCSMVNGEAVDSRWWPSIVSVDALVLYSSTPFCTVHAF